MNKTTLKEASVRGEMEAITQVVYLTPDIAESEEEGSEEPCQ